MILEFISLIMFYILRLGGEATVAEYQIGTTELRQKLTDVIQKVREEKATYIVETFGRPQVVILATDEYERLQAFRRQALGEKAELARAAFGMWRGREEQGQAGAEMDRGSWNSAWSEDAGE